MSKHHLFQALRQFNVELSVPEPRATPVVLSGRQQARIEKFLQASLAENTRLAYKQAWQRFVEFCQRERFQPLPAAPEVVAAYLAERAAPGRGQAPAAVATIQIELSGIAYIHDKLGHKSHNPARSEAVKAVMAGIRRTFRQPSQGKAPITRDKLLRLLSALPHSDAGVRDRALLLLGFALALRRSELVSLNLKHIVFNATGVCLTLPYSKTDPTGEGTVFNIQRRAGDDPLCVVRALEHWLQVVQAADVRRQQRGLQKLGRRQMEAAEKADPARAFFRSLGPQGTPTRTRLSAQAVAVIVKQAVERAMEQGVWDPQQDGQLQDFSGHSLRAGYITTAAEQQVPEWQIQKVTRHKSTAVLRRYIRTDIAQQEAIDRVLDAPAGPAKKA